LIGGVVLLSAVVGGGYFYFFNNDQFYNLVSMSDDSSPNPSAKEMERMKMELQNLRTELDQYIGVNESVEEMENQIISLKQRIDNVAAKLEDEIGNFELESNRRSQRLEEISQRLGQLKVTENISLETKEEVERLRVSIKEIHEQSLSSELLIAKKLEDYKQMLDLEEGKKVSVSKSEKARNKENNLDSTYGEVITKIGPLKLESIVSHGSQRVAELSDMISGAIPIIEGDQVGQYQIRKITSDSVLIESLSGDKFTLVQEG
jgi:chromosome segregation ATPase